MTTIGSGIKSIVDFHIDVLSGIDLTGLNNYIATTSGSNTTTAITQIQTNLTNLNSIIDSTYLTSQNVILKQQQAVLDILSRERGRLNIKKDNVDNVLGNQKRINSFNDSYSSRNIEYSYLFFKIIIALVIILFFTILEKYASMPSVILTGVYILVFSYLIVMVPYDLYYIYIRDRMNFDKISQKALIPPKATTDTFTNFEVLEPPAGAVPAAAVPAPAGGQNTVNNNMNSCVSVFNNNGLTSSLLDNVYKTI